MSTPTKAFRIIEQRPAKITCGVLLVLGLIAAIVTPLYLIYSSHNQANAYLDDFDPGNIMSDFVMGNKSTMTEADINNFLHSKNPCNDTNLSKADPYIAQGYQYTIRDGHFVCMADDSFGGESAAHIIWQAAQDYSINPQVLIVLLEKEQSLVTDTWPNHRQYASATGFACPDDGSGCNTKDAGFKNQVRKAAALFREVLDGGWSNYPAYTTQYIQYHPNTACGGSNIYIQNRATSALYRYTPYQPNQSAINAGTGTGDSCSSYGNRNFYNLFTNWFGSTQYKITGNIVLPDGIYIIHPAKNTSKSIDLDAGSQTDGAKIQLWDNIDSSNGQKYQFKRGTDGYYTISSLASGKAIALDGSTTYGTKLVQTSDTSSCSSKWSLTLDNDSYKIVSACNGLAIDMPNGATTNGLQLQIWDDNASSAQRWTIKRYDEAPVESGIYTIRNTTSDKVIDISNGGRKNASRVQIWKENVNINTQKFRIHHMDDGLYVIESLNSGKVIDLSGANLSNGATIQTWSYNGSACAQRWNIVQKGDGYTLLSSCGGNYAWDIDGGQLNVDGAKIHLWSSSNFASQTFKFSPTEPIITDGTYVIEFASDTGMAMDINGGSKNNGEYAHLWQKIDGLASQQFIIKLEDDGYYSIQNNNSKLFIGSANNSSIYGTRVVQALGDGQCGQEWVIFRQRDSVYTLQNGCSGKAMDLSNNEATNGRTIHIWDQNNTNAQNWVLRRI